MKAEPDQLPSVIPPVGVRAAQEGAGLPSVAPRSLHFIGGPLLEQEPPSCVYFGRKRQQQRMNSEHSPPFTSDPLTLYVPLSVASGT